MTLDYALKEGFIDLRLKNETQFDFDIAKDQIQPYVFVPRSIGGIYSWPMIVNTLTRRATFLTTIFVKKYGVKIENVLPGYEFIRVEGIPALDDPSLL